MKALIFIRNALTTLAAIGIIAAVVGSSLYNLYEGALDCMPKPGPACNVKR